MSIDKRTCEDCYFFAMWNINQEYPACLYGYSEECDFFKDATDCKNFIEETYGNK